jgi:hypothetical protein
MYSVFLAMALGQRVISNPMAQGAIAVANWLLLILFVAMYAMKLGGAVA